MIDVTIDLTAAHKGYYKFSICDLKDPSTYEAESCFRDVMFADGSSKFYVTGAKKDMMKLRLPSDLTCERCVFRWIYRAGTSSILNKKVDVLLI